MNQYGSLPRNAKACIAVEPLWSFFGPIVTYYAPLYQRARGLDEVQMGTINSAHIAAGFIFFALASPITNRLGRRKTSLVFDLIAWSAAMLVWAFAKNFAWFLAAGILNAVVRIVVVSWNLLITEDAREDQRSSIHGWMHLIGSASGLVVFLGGLVIGRFGIIESMRVIYLVGALSMTFMFTIRYLLTRETAAGLILREKYKGRSFAASVFAQVGESGRALRDPRFLRLLGLFFVANAVLYIDFYRILYLQETKALDSTTVAFMPAFGAVLSIILFFFVMPRLPKFRDTAVLSWSFLLCAVFQAGILLAPKNSVLLSVLAVGCLQTSFFLVQAFRDAVFMNSVDEQRRGDLFSLVQALTLLISIPVGWLSGLMYSANSTLPFVMAFVLYLLGFVISGRIKTHEGAKL
ncbi:MAG: MFS transporter [Rectinemataceae bacterium]